MITATFDALVDALELDTTDDVPSLIGLAIPYGTASLPSSTNQLSYRFSGPPLESLIGTVAVREHDDATPIGLVTSEHADDLGVSVNVELLETTSGKDSRIEASAGVRNGFSVAFDPVSSVQAEDGVIDVSEYRVMHLGHVRRPAFVEATATVAASANTETEVAEMAETVAVEATPPAIIPSAVVSHRPGYFPSLAQYAFAVIHSRLGDTAASARLAEYRQAVQLAAGETLVGDIGGVIPTQIVTPVIDARAYDRPIFNALGANLGPSSGASWNVPIVSDPIADALAVTELQGSSDTLGITNVSVAWQAIKRTTTVSRESEIYSDPSIVGIVGEQLARAYARGSEKIAAATLTGATGGNTAIVLASDGSDAVAQVVNASTVHYGQVGAPADTLFTNPTDYSILSGWTAADGRQLFPSAGSLVNGSGETSGATAFGGNVAGVRLVVSWALNAGQNYLISSDYVKTYEGNRATISVESANFGTTLGIFGTVAGKVLVSKAVTPVSIAPVIPLAKAAK